MGFLELVYGAAAAMAATSAGAAGVLAFKRIDYRVYPIIISFCSGVMSFSVFEMITQSHSISGDYTVFTGLLAGLSTFLVIEKILPHAHLAIRKRKISDSKKKATLLAGTITIHNIPEGFAIASAFAGSSPLGWLVTTSIALQDIPEGLVVSTPLACYGVTTKRSFFWGVFSGVVEFTAAIVGYLLLTLVAAATPFALAFSSGAMSYVVLFELLPDAFNGRNRNAAAVSFIAGVAAAFGLATLLAF